jgi:hypothetical protein
MARRRFFESKTRYIERLKAAQAAEDTVFGYDYYVLRLEDAENIREMSPLSVAIGLFIASFTVVWLAGLIESSVLAFLGIVMFIGHLQYMYFWFRE